MLKCNVTKQKSHLSIKPQKTRREGKFPSSLVIVAVKPEKVTAGPTNWPPSHVKFHWAEKNRRAARKDCRRRAAPVPMLLSVYYGLLTEPFLRNRFILRFYFLDHSKRKKKIHNTFPVRLIIICKVWFIFSFFLLWTMFCLQTDDVRCFPFFHPPD